MPPVVVVSAPANGVSSSASIEAANKNPPPATRSYSAVVSKIVVMNPRLSPILLAPRPITCIYNTPPIILTQIEEEQLSKQRENTLIMKFSARCSHLYDIWCHIHS